MALAWTKKQPDRDPSDLMCRIKSGQWDALRELYQQYGNAVYGLAKRRLEDNHLAEDVVQEVFLRIWRHAGDWDSTRGPLDTWVLVITRHVIYDVLRQMKNRPDFSVADQIISSIVDPEDALDDVMDAQSLHQMLSLLSIEQQEVVRMVYADDLPAPLVAKKLGIPLGTVKSRLRLALRHLRHQLDGEAYSDDAL